MLANIEFIILLILIIGGLTAPIIEASFDNRRQKRLERKIKEGDKIHHAFRMGMHETFAILREKLFK